MKFHVLNGKGHETFVVEQRDVVSEAQRLLGEGYYAMNPKTGERYGRAEDVPGTVDELLWGKLERRGEHGF